MSLGTLVVTKLVGTFALFFGFLVWQLVSVRRELRRDREGDAADIDKIEGRAPEA